VVTVREIPAGSTMQAADAMLVLRPRWGTPQALAAAVDEQLRPAGYRLVGVFEDGDGREQEADGPRALAVAGFREMTMLAWGRLLYVDDVSTLPEERGAGHADRLLTWLEDEARRLGCEGVHLDSGVGPDRAPAHRLYMRHRMRISAHHFQRDL
jgi:GNAT superfamily N-acetyltransferase